MRIWVDADACPNVIKDILFRAAKRTHTPLMLVANQALRLPPSPYVKLTLVAGGFDVADQHIIQHAEIDDLVVTADIPLAAAIVDKGGIALNPRGLLYTQSNIKERLSMRNFSEGLRSSGVITGGPAPLTKKEIQDFANVLDRFLSGNSR